MGRVITIPRLVAIVAVFAAHLSCAQSIETQLKWLTNPKGWLLKSVSRADFKEQSKDITDQYSPCVLSGIITFNADGTYKQVFTKKDCADQLIEDQQGTWQYFTSPKIQKGIMRIVLQDSKIKHHIRSYLVSSFDENTLMAWSNISYSSSSQTMHTFKLNGSPTVAVALAVTEPAKQPLPKAVVAATEYANMNEVRAVFTEAEIAAANTAAMTSYLPLEERGVVMYTNLARMVPKKFSILMKNHIATQEAEVQEEYNKSSYYKSLQKQLVTMNALPPLLPDKKMYILAKCWAEESGRKGLYGHDRQDCDGGEAAENCSYGCQTAIEITFQLLVDPGNEDHGHRDNLFTTDHKGFGVAIDKHITYSWCAVEDFSDDTDREREEGLRMKAEFEKTLAQWTAEERKAADVCRSLAYLNDYEKDFFFYFNLIRINPAKFQSLVWKDKPMFVLSDNYASTPKDKEAQYQKLKLWLASAKPGPAAVPDQTLTKGGRCVAKQMINKQKGAPECSTQANGMGVVYTKPEEYYNSIMNVFVMGDMTFTSLLESDKPVVIAEKTEYFEFLVLMMY